MLIFFKKTLSILILVGYLASCSSESNQSEEIETSSDNSQTSSSRSNASNKENYHGLRSWQDIKQSGVIRALRFEWEEESSLPRSGSTSLFHIELFNQFASKHQLQVEWIKVKDLKQMFSYLVEHKADVIPRHLTVTESRSKIMNFTYTLVKDVEVLVAAKGTEVPSSKEVITVTVPQNTAYIEGVSRHFPKWQITYTDAALNSEEIADALVAKEIEYSVLDGQSVETLLGYRDDIVALLELPETRQLAWAVNPNNNNLLNKLNEFISVHQVTETSRQSRTLDFEEMKRNHLPLRIITRNSPETYFLWRGELMGFEYELMREFAKRHKVRLEVIVADNFQQMKDLLIQGKGDVIAAGMSKTQQRQSEFTFSTRYNRVSELLVANKNSPAIKTLSDLKGRTIFIRKTSAFWSTAQQLSKQYAVNVVAADENIPTELLIAQVEAQEIDLTIADSNLVSIEQRFRDDIVTPLTLKEGVPYSYGVRNSNPLLLIALNAFIKKEYRGTFYNVIKGKYFASHKRLQKYREQRITSDSKLSPYDDLVINNAQKYQFDWRLITAQMYQESRFNPDAISPAGAQGLMQLLPRTAKELGFVDLFRPAQSIAAGVQYMNWTRNRFSQHVPLEEQIFFALAAYNAGFGHVKDAQRLAKKINLRSDKWFGNVEKAMLLLQNPKYYKQTRFGYCRGSEPVNYVREIHQRYLTYVEIIH